MLTISKIKQSASDASRYYLQEEKDYYLSEKSIGSKPIWLGKMAKEAGLLGKAVTEQELERVLSGSLAGESVTRPENHRPGWDLTVSAPKSFSIIAMHPHLGDKRLVDIHNKAIEFTARLIEKDTAQVRDRISGTEDDRNFEKTGAMIAAAVPHITSRENEIQFHTHLLVANLTRDSEGVLRAMGSCTEQRDDEVKGMSEQVYRDSKYYGTVYQSILATGVQKIGYQVVGRGNGQFEIVGLPEGANDAYSTRRAQTLEKAEEYNVSSSAGMAVAAKDSRKPKQLPTLDALEFFWADKFPLKDLSIESLTDNKTVDSHHIPEDAPVVIREKAKHAIDRTVSYISKHQSAVRYEKLMQLAISEFAFGNGIDYVDLSDEIDRQVKAGDLIALNKQKTLLTTKILLDRESKLIESVKDKKVNPPQLDSKTLAKLNLSEEHKSLIANLLTSSDQHQIVTLKTDTTSPKALVEGLLNVAENNHQRVIILSPGRDDKNILSESTKRQAKTKVQWFKNLFRSQDIVHTTGAYLKEAQQNPKEQEESGNIIVIDQANKLRLEDELKLIDLADKRGDKLIYINQDKGLRGYASGNVITSLKQGQVRESIFVEEKVKQQVQVKLIEAKDDHERILMLAKDYAHFNQFKRDRTQVLAGNLKEAHTLTAILRDELKQTGALGRVEKPLNVLKAKILSSEHRQVAKHYSPGMIVRFFTDKKVFEYEVAKVNEEKNTLTLINEKGEASEFKPGVKNTHNLMAYERIVLPVAMGDKIASGNNIKYHHIKSGDSFTVSGMGQNHVKLKRDNGKTLTIPWRDLEHRSIYYNFVRTPNQASRKRDTTLLSSKVYAANKTVLDNIMDKSRQEVRLYSEDADKLKSRVLRGEVKETAISTLNASARAYVVNDAASLESEKYINTSTSEIIKRDINALCQAFGLNDKKSIADKAFEFALDHLTEKEAAFRHQDLVKEALNFGLLEYDVPVSKEEVDQKLESLKAKGELLSREYHDGVRWTTRAEYDREKRLLDLMKSTQNTLPPLLEKEFVDKYLLARKALTPSQKDAISLITTNSDRFVAIQGLAGTGKSTMLSDAINTTSIDEMVNLSGKDTRFIGLAKTHQAVNELQDKGVQAQTLASFFVDIDKSEQLDGKFKSTVFLIDEFSMLSTKDQEKLTDIVIKGDGRAAFVGDIEQLPGYSAGKPVEQAIRTKSIQTGRLTDILRQNDAPTPHLKQAIESTVDKKIEQALQLLKDQPSFTEYRGELLTKEQLDNIIDTSAQTHRHFTDDPKLNREIAQGAIVEEGAKEYLSRTERSREGSLFIAYTHKERDDFAALLREGLQQQGALAADKKIEDKDGNERVFKVDRLRSIPLTRAQLRSSHTYSLDSQGNTASAQKLILSIGQKYYDVMPVKGNKIEIDRIDSGQKEKLVLSPDKLDHRNTHLWSLSKRPLSEGDQVMLRKADKKRGHYPSIPYTVSSVDTDDGKVVFKNDKESLTLNTQELKDTHWDYNYVRTSDMNQGATDQSAVAMINSQASLTDLMRFYVDISRARKHVKIITDNKEALKARLEGTTLQAVASFHGKRLSSIDTIHKTQYAHEPYFPEKENTIKVDHALDQNPFNTRINDHITTLWDHDKINAAFLKQGYFDLLGAPEKTNKDTMVIAGYTIITDGQNKGKWTNSKHYGELKDAVDLVKETYRKKGMRQEVAGYQAANETTCRLVGIDPDEVRKEVDLNRLRIVSAKSAYKVAKSIKNTLGEKYLHETRGISKDTLARSYVKFIPSGSKYLLDDKEELIQKVSKIPAVLIAAVNNDRKVTGVQRIYLDRYKPIKSTFMEDPKISRGVIRGSAGLIQKGGDDKVFIAEGPETALSIAQVNPDSTVLTSFSTNNIVSMVPFLKSLEVKQCIIAGDNDGISSEAFKLTEQAVKTLNKAGLNTISIYPKMLPDQDKTDFNDVLQKQGVDQLKEMVKTAISAQSLVSENVLNKLIDQAKQTGDFSAVDKINAQLNKLMPFIKTYQVDPSAVLEKVQSQDISKQGLGDIGKLIDQLKSASVTPDKTTEYGKFKEDNTLANIDLQI